MTKTTSPAEHPVLIDGAWRKAAASGSFSATSPATGEQLPEVFPTSKWSDLDDALDAAAQAFVELQATPRSELADFLRKYADLIEARADEIAAAAHLETAFPIEPRLRSGELPRTTDQLRQAAQACLDPAWRFPTVDEANNIRSILEPLGPVLAIGPNNFPLAFNGVSGGDFAAAIAAGCPVIGKAHHLHPNTSRLLAEAAQEAATNLPSGAVQMVYAMAEADGLRAAADPRLAAVAFTGSRTAGLKLKRAADEVGKPAFVELSSVNPVVILPGALAERFEEIVDETVASALMGAGQFCTNPGLLVTLAGESTDRFVKTIADRYSAAEPAPLLGAQGLEGLEKSIHALCEAGATLLEGGQRLERDGYACRNTLLRIEGASFLKAPERLQAEAFGNCTQVIVCDDLVQAKQVLASLEGNLTGCIYSATDGSEERAYDELAPVLTARVGRLLNDKMPTGVAVSPAMNHGGPYPATGHPHFTAVGLPAACRRFTRLVCYDNVRPHRLPETLR